MGGRFIPNPDVSWVASNVLAYLEAAGREYEPHELAAILHFTPQQVTDALYSLDLMDRRQWERRSQISWEWDGVERRWKERRAGDAASAD